jgi:hypothetical protein
MKLPKREDFFKGAPSRAGIIQARFAAYPQCCADQKPAARRVGIAAALRNGALTRGALRER